MLTRADLDALGVTTDVATAAKALGISASAAYKAINDGNFPVRVIPIGGRYTIPTADLRREVLGEVTPPADITDRLDRILSTLDAIVQILKVQSINSIAA
ncbi:helix-turn-helix domain-containing protein [Gordonia sp. L191]|uniref:helix-turn-helix domain-containing protein n=1 Tax=Gordonia sp. L191 TaxID=2982699 RepID=UPI0024BFA4D3|nr:helix-turn-helix domain-containing protein [Gordonia sp. L191]WHU45166.1 helix-turn-helix domain-containing protein [Gordonia sp. L191]